MSEPGSECAIMNKPWWRVLGRSRREMHLWCVKGKGSFHFQAEIFIAVWLEMYFFVAQSRPRVRAHNRQEAINICACLYCVSFGCCRIFFYPYWIYSGSFIAWGNAIVVRSILNFFISEWNSCISGLYLPKRMIINQRRLRLIEMNSLVFLLRFSHLGGTYFFKSAKMFRS